MIKRIKIPIYDVADLVVIVDKDIDKYTKKYKSMEVAKDSVGLCFFSEYSEIVVYLNPEATEANPWRIIPHECLHAVYKLFDYIGLDYTYEGQESFTYMLGWFCQEVHKVLEKYIKNNLELSN